MGAKNRADTDIALMKLPTLEMNVLERTIARGELVLRLQVLPGSHGSPIVP